MADTRVALEGDVPITRAPALPRPLRALGKRARSAKDGVAELVLFLSDLVSSIAITRPRLRDILESLEQVLSIGWRPVVFVSLPIGMTFALSFDSLLGLIGMRSLGSVGLVPAIVREAGPLFGGIVAAATVGSAFAADIGARRVRDEISGSEVMGVSPRARLYLPRILGSMLGCPILGLYATITALIGGFLLLVLLRGVSAGVYLNGFGVILRTGDIVVLVAKGVLYGLVVGISACFFGDRAKGGPAGVAAATRASIIASFAVIALVGFIVNQIAYAP
ncbi:MAG: ABC transporter permease [Acidimicrobiia bacterium]|nr:ABC transporter permease [Acidimicrobiia bacterium]